MEKKERKIKANGKQFAKRKTNRYTRDECKIELNRLESGNQKNSKYFSDVQKRYLELGGNFAK